MIGTAIVAAGVTGTLALGALVGVIGTVTDQSPALCQQGTGIGGTDPATGDGIPPAYLRDYQLAGQRYGIAWQILGAIGQVESDHGRDPTPGSGVHQGANTAGAMGPMQLMPGEWAAYGDHNPQHVYNPDYAIPAAAAKLSHDGIHTNLDQALYRYNPAWWYVTKVETTARNYANGQDPHTLAPSAADQCTPDVLPPNQAAAQVIAFARAQLGKPYLWGGTGPGAYDCSGLTQAAYAAAGITIPRIAADQWHHEPHIPAGQQQPGDLIFFITDGTPADPGHVAIVLDTTHMIAAPHTGTTIQIQTYPNRPDLVGFARPAPPPG